MHALVLLVLVACLGRGQSEPPSGPPPAPVAPPVEVAPDPGGPGRPAHVDRDAAADPLACFDACMAERQVEARAIGAIEASCRGVCDLAGAPDPFGPAAAPPSSPGG